MPPIFRNLLNVSVLYITRNIKTCPYGIVPNKLIWKTFKLNREDQFCD